MAAVLGSGLISLCGIVCLFFFPSRALFASSTAPCLSFVSTKTMLNNQTLFSSRYCRGETLNVEPIIPQLERTGREWMQN